MTLEIGYVLGLLLVALVLFATEIVGLDIAALVILLLLVLPGVLSPEEALRSFGNETLVVLVSLFVLTAGVTHTGVVARVGLRIASLAGRHPGRVTRLLLFSATTLSAFISNTVTTAALLPLAVGGARRAKMPAGRILMPLAFASVLAGSVTLVGTTTNIVVSGEMERFELAPIGFFELAPVGIAIVTAGMLYLFLLAPRLLPRREEGELVERYGVRTYFSEVVLTEGSTLAGKRIGESRLGKATDLNVIGVRRDGRRTLAPSDDLVLAEGDVLLVEGQAEEILSVKDVAGIEIHPDFELSDPDLVSEKVRMVEAMVVPGSRLTGRTLGRSRLHQRGGLTVLGIHSPDIHGRLGQLRRRAAGRATALPRRQLHAGDVLLLQGTEEAIALIDAEDLLVLDDKSAHHPRRRRGALAAAIFAGALVAGASGLAPLSIALMSGAVLLVITRCLTSEEAYAAVDWRLIVLVAAMIAFGFAMEESGAAAWIASSIIVPVSALGPLAVLAAVYLLTVLLTQPMSNQAAALVVLPIALQVARATGIEPRALAMDIVFAASCSFLTPLEPACFLVYGPGRYRFFDYVRAGGPLTLIVFAISMALIPIVWPLQP